jgi:hypothetical protein
MLERTPSPSRRPLLLASLLLGIVFFSAPSTLRAGEDKGHGSATDKDKDGDKDGDDRDDPVTLSFTTVGDSRQDPVTFDPTTAPLSGQDAIWLQNTKAFSRILRSVQDARSTFLFFNGDMIMGYGKAGSPADTSVSTVLKSDLMAFYRQYAFWRGVVAPTMERGTYVVPVPGNHETQSKAAGKKAQVENENAWRANMGDLILDTARFQTLFGEGPTNVVTTDTGSPDSLATDQSQLSYSFDFRGCHFAVINTDPVGHDSHAPTQWLSADLSAAKTRGAKHMFVFGHKPAFTYYYGKAPTAPLPTGPSGLDADVSARDAFWQVIEDYDATYFCGHEHIFHMEQPTASSGGHAWQVLVGSGGSPFEAAPTDTTLSVTDRAYAWADVEVRKNGKVRITAYGFDDQFGPTHKLQDVTLPK